jgi:hypothetical protein
MLAGKDWKDFQSCLAVFLGILKTLSQENMDEHAFGKYCISKVYMFTLTEKNPASEIQRFASKLHLKLKNFSRPAGIFTKMLRFDEKFQRNF